MKGQIIIISSFERHLWLGLGELFSEPLKLLIGLESVSARGWAVPQAKFANRNSRRTGSRRSIVGALSEDLGYLKVYIYTCEWESTARLCRRK